MVRWGARGLLSGVTCLTLTILTNKSLSYSQMTNEKPVLRSRDLCLDQSEASICSYLQTISARSLNLATLLGPSCSRLARLKNTDQ